MKIYQIFLLFGLLLVAQGKPIYIFYSFFDFYEPVYGEIDAFIE